MEGKPTTVKIQFRFPTEKYPKPTEILRRAMNILPDDVIEYFIDNPIMFSAEFEDFRANAMLITHDTFKNHKYLIHFNYHIWDHLDENEIIHIILHELAHAYLGHEAERLSFKKSRKFIAKQENEVERLVNKWLNS